MRYLVGKKIMIRSVIKDNSFFQVFFKFFLKNGDNAKASANFKKLFSLLFAQTNLGCYTILNKIYRVLYINFEVRKIKKYRSSYLVPVPTKKKRRCFLIVKWLFDAAYQDKRLVPFYNKLSLEILKYLENKESEGKKKKFFTLKLALLNRANSHYRWY